MLQATDVTANRQLGQHRGTQRGEEACEMLVNMVQGVNSDTLDT